MKRMPGSAFSQISGDREALRLSAVSTLVFGLLAHGYRYANAAFSGDAALISQAGEEAYQISLGRFLQPLWWRIRGTVTAPFLIGLFCLIFLVFSGCLTARILRIRNRAGIVFSCGILTVSETLGLANATYLPWSDVYMLSLCLALLGAYLSLRGAGIRRHLAPLCYAALLGLYQSYLPSAAAIIVIALLADLVRGEAAADIWRRGALAVLHLLAGLLLYAALLRLILGVFGISASSDYNGVGRVSLLSARDLLHYLGEAWMTPLRFLFFPRDREMIPWHISQIPQILNLGALILSFFLVFTGRRHSVVSLATSVFLLLILPLAANFVMVISQGVVNGLMMYAWYFLYLLPVVLSENPGRVRRTGNAAGLCAALLAGVYIFVNTISCNTMYVKRDLEYAATHSAMTRILSRMEETEGYVPGETPVVIAGVLPSSQIAMMRPGMEEISAVQGMRYTYGASYETSAYWYLASILGARLNLVPHGERTRLVKQTKEIRAMPRFPQDGCAAMIGDHLFLRLN
ncbi:MAG: glucosyltransferase domain-containing protein [Clostridiales bacterium]|nr:glucosyltransferase domain-containing protein [Clostridiales bacterium]